MWESLQFVQQFSQIRVAESKQNQFDSDSNYDSQLFFHFDSDSGSWALFSFDSGSRLFKMVKFRLRLP